MSKKCFEDFDFNDFWKDDTKYSLEHYTGKPVTNEMIRTVEKDTGYRLPASYIELLKSKNGGLPRKTCFPANGPTSWAEKHVAITGISGIDKTTSYSLNGSLGSKFHIDIWEYPEDGIYICDCPSAGHDLILLDYSECGKEGEPIVVHVDQEYDYKKTFLAKDFETFVRGLVTEEEIEKLY